VARKVEEKYWRCSRYPWGCCKKHRTKKEAQACEKMYENNTVWTTPSKKNVVPYWACL
jgi:hypothetical protein